MTDFLNPYNFVRVPDAPKPTDAETTLLWRCPPPPHDRRTGLSGRIECDIEVLTPLFVSDSDGVTTDDNGHDTYPFFNVNGQRLIPGTSLRGPIRSVFEAVTNSTFGVFNDSDQPLFYRMPPEKALGLVPAILEQNANGKAHLRLLPGRLDVQPKSKNLYAAWLPAYPNRDKLQLRDERKHRHVLAKRDLVRVPEDCRDGSECWGAIRKTTNRDKGFPHWQVDFIHKDERAVRDWIDREGSGHRAMLGYVYATGLNIDLKQYERFFFYDPNKPAEYASLAAEVANRYNALMQDYHDREEEISNSLSSQASGSRRLQPSIFIKHQFKLFYGALVYVELTGSRGNYEAKALYPVNVSRVAYTTPVKDLLPKHALPATDYDALCLASRVFGWVHPRADDNLQQRVAYAGRVQFSHALVNEDDMEPGPFTLQVLGSPNPTSVEFYLNIHPRNVNAHRDKPHGYDAPDVSLKGRKLYRHHGEITMRSKEVQAQEATKFNRSLTEVVKPGARLRFSIDFQNLQPVELGALLWTLQLQQGDWQGVHRIGYGKPLGLGSVRIATRQLWLIDPKARYVDGDEGIFEDTSPEHYVTAFVAAMQRLYGQPLSQQAHFKDLASLLDRNGADRPVHYPRQGNTNEKNFEWFMANKKRKTPRVLPYPTEDERLPRKP